jgi:hypothetical protein
MNENNFKKRSFFDSTIKLFKNYRRKMIQEKMDGYNSNLSDEVDLRLRQLSIICKKLYSFEKIILKPTDSIKEASKLSKYFDEGIIFAEAFYSTAWRIIFIAKHKKRPLPHLNGWKNKAKGITTVRNQLLVHPENKDSLILMPSYSWGKNGPQFKTARSMGQTFDISDRGLWINAQEFKEDFEELLQKAIVLNQTNLN